jgi:DDE superfamily endonuclease
MKLAQWRAHQLVFVDEAGINSKLGERSHGYSKKGCVIPHKVTPGRAPNFSLLPAITVDGYIACNLYPGAINAERFEDFIRNDVLPHCNEFPGPRSVIIMDNASIHRGEVLLRYEKN